MSWMRQRSLSVRLAVEFVEVLAGGIVMAVLHPLIAKSSAPLWFLLLMMVAAGALQLAAARTSGTAVTGAANKSIASPSVIGAAPAANRAPSCRSSHVTCTHIATHAASTR